ncbi:MULTISPECIES: hypothetical protein [Chromobacterium]|uniref:Uncharacterized protein n=2 Tax=Chromobacterium TaxID=535 RepID=A0AAX2M6A6_CHRVL|nr:MULTISPECIES: hypothetical protein [Chromobacterium]PRP68648.1 hypothetical protein BUE93_21250 [Chromobacterium amazonense]STB64423.1 Uncharacterised protein [Chromobacterium violaceum]STB70855.1 Uncharacterised protein [Chromobacterium violaceum]STB71224.1 Uncharacterised protein [Chromobacterium violaceum]SUX31795.1 Uncharacterised protein [Chromobacterium violaceum]
MKYEDILAAFQQASGFDLYRLRAMLDRVLDDPKWIVAVRQSLHIGQQVAYFDPATNQQHAASVVEFRRKEVVVRRQESGQYWVIPYAAINLDGADVKIRETGHPGLSRHELAVGETVGFLDHEQRQRQGQIVRLNDKTVTLISDGQKWRVSYNYLHHVFDAG